MELAPLVAIKSWYEVAVSWCSLEILELKGLVQFQNPLQRVCGGLYWVGNHCNCFKNLFFFSFKLLRSNMLANINNIGTYPLRDFEAKAASNHTVMCFFKKTSSAVIMWLTKLLQKICRITLKRKLILLWKIN